MAGLDLLTFGTEQYRIGSWRGRRETGYLAPLSPPERISRPGLQRGLTRLSQRGYREVLTAALNAAEQQVFLRAGFTVHERLHLLHHDLVDIPDVANPVRLRRARRWERSNVLALDGRAFDDFWHLDEASLREAIEATPQTRFEVAVDDGLAGYAITGVAADHGYLQRLAVDPSRQGRGVAASLVCDGLRWSKSRRCRKVSVNTQERNERALALYERMGFVRDEPGLAVLRIDLGEPR
jgi:ribosomal protein S18 acetylase RimI-like enzyme